LHKYLSDKINVLIYKERVMVEGLKVINLKKTFKLSAKQQKLEKTKDKVRKAVDGLSFEAYKGEIYGLLGPNGAGKTTTLRVIATLIKPDEGDVIIDGLSVVKDAGKVRGKIGFLTSDMKLEAFFTPNYLFDFFASLYGMSEDKIKSRKEELFKMFGIDEFAEVKISDLSSGMKQKTSLAMSILHDPDLIVFDEPTNGLDVTTAKTVTDFLLRMRDEGKTIILSSHVLSLIEKVCDRVGIIMRGKMVVEGRVDELTKEKDLETIFIESAREVEFNEKRTNSN